MNNASLANQVYTQLRAEIMGGQVSQNKMLVERELTERFQISRVPVREALQRLCQEGYLISYPRKGYMINRLSEEYIFEIQRVRYQLEVYAARLVIRNASDEQIRSLSQWTERNLAETDPYQTYNTMFHAELTKMSGNQVLHDTVYKYLGEVAMGAFQYPSLMNVPDYHEEIVKALLDRNLEGAHYFLKLDMQLDRNDQGRLL